MNYSQNSEQSAIESYFGDFVGTFLDIGSNDGITLSNTYALTKKGWKGTLVDASVTAYKKLCKNYESKTGYYLIHTAVGASNGEVILHESGELLGQGDSALVSSVKSDEVKRWDSANIKFQDVSVRMMTFANLLQLTPQKTFDLISVDIEGSEYETIPQIDFASLKTKMAIIEFNGKNKEYYEGIMKGFGMYLTESNQENLIFRK